MLDDGKNEVRFPFAPTSCKIEALPLGGEWIGRWIELPAKQADGVANRFVVALLSGNDTSRQITGNFRLELFCRSLLVVIMHSQHDQWLFDAPGPTVVKQPDDAIRLGGVAKQRPYSGEQFDFGHIFADNKSRLIRYRADC